jgi:hypothetical protein
LLQVFVLTVLNRVSQALAEAKDLKEVKALWDKAEAARQYARSSARSAAIIACGRAIPAHENPDPQKRKRRLF